MALDSCVFYASTFSGGATAALARNRFVKLAAARKFVVTAANDYPDGVLYEKAGAAGDVVSVADFRRSQTLRVEASVALTDGHYGKATADGKVADDGAAGTSNSCCKIIGSYVAGDIAQVLSLG